MQPGEVIVVRLKGGPAIGRYSATGAADRRGGRAGRVRVAIGRNREAQLPPERVIMWTGLVPAGDREVEELRENAERLSGEVDLREVWELVHEEPGTLSTDDLADLSWGSGSSLPHKVAIVLHLAREPLYFEEVAGGYSARSEDAVRQVLERRERDARNAADSGALVEHLSAGSLPETLSAHQRAQLGHIRGLVVHGDSYTRSASAIALLKEVDPTTRDVQRLGFDLLVDAGVLSPDYPLELERAGIPNEFSEETRAEAKNVDAGAAMSDPGRADLLDITTITIDEEHTDDRDDALSLEVAPDGSYLVGVHIADAGALIPVGGAIDTEADRRMSTLYLPDTKVPMVPPEMSEGTGSLTAGQSKATLSVTARISVSGEVLDWDVVPSVIKSRAALSYEEAERAQADPAHPWHEQVSGLTAVGDIPADEARERGRRDHRSPRDGH